PTSGVVIWDNVKNFTNDDVTITGYTPEQVGFFIIPNGDNKNSSLEPNTEITFKWIEDGNGSGEWQAFAGDTALIGEGAHVLFDVASLNKDNLDHVKDNAKPGNLNWEDLSGGGDNDYNDINIGVEWSSNLPELTTQDADTLGSNSDSAEANFAGLFDVTANVGADGLGNQSVTYSLTIQSPESGLASGGDAINLYLIDGKVVGSTATSSDNVKDVNTVFDITVDATGNIKQTQYAQIDHTGENNDGDASNNSANLVTLTKGAITLTATATIQDADGDQAVDVQAIDISESLGFEDDVPVIGTFESLSIDNTEVYSASGQNTGFLSGADGWQSITLGGTAPAGVTYSYNSDNGVLTAIDGVRDPVFTLSLNERGEYSFELLKPEAGSLTSSIDFDSANAGSPSATYDYGDFVAIASGTNGKVNPSNQGLAGDGNSLAVGEAITFQFDNLQTVDQVVFGLKAPQGGTFNYEFFNGTTSIGSGSVSTDVQNGDLQIY
ncbi:MAG: DUF4114 domain-containing protein, partial [Rhodobacteraceae bacterium]|nr:DUF4114 domain-containing protein [Paracoccaceae bacterium]